MFSSLLSLHRARWMRSFCLFFMTLASMAVAWHLVVRVLYELSGPFSYDSLVFAAVGRGLLNGLTLYRDLLEVKPPGIFLVGALSLRLTDSFALIHILNACIVVAIPLLVALAALWHEQRRRAWGVLPLALGAFVFGGLLSLYIFDANGGYQVETFGVLGGLVYVAAIDHPRGILSRRRICLAGLGILVAAGFKEPFFLSLVACALFFAKRPYTLVRSLVVPCLAAGVAGILILSVLGALSSYVYEYLLPMAASRASQSLPLWQRGLRPDPIIARWWVFSPMMAVFFCTAPFLHLVRRARIHVEEGGLWGLVALLLGLYLLIFSAWSAGEIPEGRHLLFVVPGMFALFLLLLDEYAGESLRTWVSLGLCLLLSLWTVTVPAYTYGEYMAQTASIHQEAVHGRETAAQIDTILDSCGMDRYLYIGGHTAMNPYGFSRHSPLGPLFFQAPSIFNTFRKGVREAFSRNIGTAPFIVFRRFTYMEDMAFLPAALSYLQTHFSTQPWPCAGHVGLPADPSLIFLFRTSAEQFVYSW